MAFGVFFFFSLSLFFFLVLEFKLKASLLLGRCSYHFFVPEKEIEIILLPVDHMYMPLLYTILRSDGKCSEKYEAREYAI
jgi:hypothetical protein